MEREEEEGGEHTEKDSDDCKGTCNAAPVADVDNPIRR